MNLYYCTKHNHYFLALEDISFSEKTPCWFFEYDKENKSVQFLDPILISIKEISDHSFQMTNPKLGVEIYQAIVKKGLNISETWKKFMCNSKEENNNEQNRFVL